MTTKQINDALAIQLANLGLTIENPEEDLLQESNSKIAKHNAYLALEIVRAWAGNTIFRDAYRAAMAKQPFSHKLSLAWLVTLFNDEKNRKQFMQQALKFVKPETITKAPDGTEMNVIDKFTALQGVKLDKWALIRAMNRAASLSNYGNFKNNRGFIYLVESDHKITQVISSGEYRWTEPENLTIKIAPAQTEEEYNKPYKIVQITNPENPDEMVKTRVYKFVGNAFKVSTSTTQEALAYEEKPYGKVSKLAPGESFLKEYDKELSHTEFEREVNSDLAMILREAEENNIKAWPLIDIENRSITIYNAGPVSQDGPMEQYN